MHVITQRRLREFWEKHADAESDLRDWHRLMKAKRYQSPHEVREDFPDASFLGDELTVFNIKPHGYRLVVYMRYRTGKVYIRYPLTHDEYERLSKAGLLG